MATLVKCPIAEAITPTNGKLSNALATTGAVVGGALINMATGGCLGIIGTNLAIGRSWHQYCCHDCHEAFKARISAFGSCKETRKY